MREGFHLWSDDRSAARAAPPSLVRVVDDAAVVLLNRRQRIEGQGGDLLWAAQMTFEPSEQQSYAILVPCEK